MFVPPNPQFTKQTKCNNNLKNDNNRNNDFFRPSISNPQIPIIYNHDQYYYDNNSYQNIVPVMDIERCSISTRNNVMDSKKPVQSSFQNDYYTMNYDTINNNLQYNDQEANKIFTRNPVNTRRDLLEKERNNDKQDFLKVQGGYLNNMPDFRIETTRKTKADINNINYVPMARTMAIPKENI
jgi:hypothetical protein